MKLTKLFVVVSAISTLVVGMEGAARAAAKTSDFQVTTSVKSNCTISTVNIAFPDYDPLSGAAVTANGNVTIKCTKGAAGLTLALSGGDNYSSPDNQMSNGTDLLKYGLFQDSGLATRWNGVTRDIAAPGATADQSFTIYGQINSGQEASVGSYSDTVTATINY
jgi:spore coat protein U-like protein